MPNKIPKLPKIKELKSHALITRPKKEEQVKPDPYKYDMNHIMQGKLAAANVRYHLGLTAYDVYVVDDDIYIISRKAAKLIGINYHTFCTTYANLLTNSGRVRRFSNGRNNYYHVDDLDMLVKDAIDNNARIVDLCTILESPNSRRRAMEPLKLKHTK